MVQILCTSGTDTTEVLSAENPKFDSCCNRLLRTANEAESKHCYVARHADESAIMPRTLADMLRLCR
jgi:hypothetical protein